MNRKAHVARNFCVTELKNFSRSRAVLYTLKVMAVSRKRCKIEMSLLQTTNRK